MALRAPKLQPLLPCVWVISASSVTHIRAPNIVEVKLFAFLFHPGSVSFQRTGWSRSSLRMSTLAESQDARRVVWAMFAISPTNDYVLFVLNSDSASKLTLTTSLQTNPYGMI
jgi:hypothetical protein